MRTEFDKQLALLNNELISLGSYCEKAIQMSSKALAEGKPTYAEDVQALADEIAHKERDIESLCLKLLLQQQPVATDLRTVSAALKMVTDMSRIGAQSLDIAEIILLANIYTTENTKVLCDMSVAVIKMVTDSIDAFVKKDIEKAKAVIAYDDVVDRFFDEVKKMLIELFSKPETDGEYAIDLLMIAKYFERIGDHATGIAEWVLFSLTGKKEG